MCEKVSEVASDQTAVVESDMSIQAVAIAIIARFSPDAVVMQDGMITDRDMTKQRLTSLINDDSK